MIDKVEQLISVSEENGRFESKRNQRQTWRSQEKDYSDHYNQQPRRQSNYSRESNQFNCGVKSNYCSDNCGDNNNDDGDGGINEDDDGDGDDNCKGNRDQLEAIEKITKCKDYYQLLGINRETNDQELKKSYRRLALQFHPDKNQTPGASDAFKAISSAFEVLGDPEKRRIYDMTEFQRLTKPNVNPYEPYGRYNNNNNARFGTGQQMGPEDLFNVFFGNSHPYGAHHEWTNRRASQSTSGISVFLQLLPVIVFIIMSIMSSFLIRDPVFSLSRSNKYPLLRKTLDLKIPYYVKETFERDYKDLLIAIEEEVNQDFTQNLKTRCFKERNHKENLIWKAKNIGDIAFEEQVRKMKTPSCTEYQELQERIQDST